MTADHTVDHSAEHGHAGHVPGAMDISQNRKSWAGFVTFVKWSMFGILLIMIFLAVFRTNG